MTLTYVLDGRTPVPEPDVLKWARWFEKTFERPELRRVAETYVTDDVVVSTVFLGLDHNYSLTGPPLVFETMVFGGELNTDGRRYATWEDAECGHDYVVKLAKLAEGV